MSVPECLNGCSWASAGGGLAPLDGRDILALLAQGQAVMRKGGYVQYCTLCIYCITRD